MSISWTKNEVIKLLEVTDNSNIEIHEMVFCSRHPQQDGIHALQIIFEDNTLLNAFNDENKQELSDPESSLSKRLSDVKVYKQNIIHKFIDQLYDKGIITLTQKIQGENEMLDNFRE